MLLTFPTLMNSPTQDAQGRKQSTGLFGVQIGFQGTSQAQLQQEAELEFRQTAL